MTDNESPKLEAVADLSPVSPRPLHNTYTLPQVLPELQDQAEDPDVVPLELATFRTAEAAMAPNPDPPRNALDTIVVEGTSDSDNNGAKSQDVSVADDDSFDAYDEDEDGNGQEQEHLQQEETAGPEPESDDYARTFDSPKEQADVADEGGEAQQPQPEDVTKTPESMNIFEQLAGVPEQSAAQIVSADPAAPAAPAAPAQGSQPTHTTDPAQDALVPPESDQQPVPAVQEAPPHASASASPSLPQQSVSFPDPDKVDPDKLDTAVPSEEQPDVQPEDVDMNTGGDSDATAIDIQKIVDEITAKAASEQSPAKPSTSLQTPSSSSMDVDLPSLPPKPALTQEQSQQTYSPATYHHASLPNAPPFSSAPTGLPSQPAFSATNGAPGAHMSQPPTYNATPSFASYPNAYPPGTAAPQAPANNGVGLQQTYDEFLADERKHMSEAKWERFPDGSRIFIGELFQLTKAGARC